MADSRYASLKKLTKYPLALARKRRVLFFLFSLVFTFFMAHLLFRSIIYPNSKKCDVFTLFCDLFMGN